MKFKALFFKLIEKIYLSYDNNLICYDQLTGLYNLNWYELKGKKKYGDKDIYVSLLDINDFKSINDLYGHLYGNDILYKIARELYAIKKNNSKDNMIDIIRFGGDEFIVFSTKNINKQLSKIKCVSIGTAYKPANMDIKRALIDADMRMYNNKNNKKASCTD